MRGAQFHLQEEDEEETGLLRETGKFSTKFPSCINGVVSAHKQEKEEGEEELDDYSAVFDGEDDYSEESTCLQQSSIERNMYWESQQALLQEILEHYSSNGSKLREEIKKLIEMVTKTNFCDCKSKGPQSGRCANCLRGRIVDLLCAKGFHARLCTSEWKRTQRFPGGRHEYIELIARSRGKKRKIKFLIEIEFKDEFKMAKACDEHKRLIELLPETYIGKPEHLNAIVRIMCDAAKRSTTEKKIHMGPWRTKSFMKMKWSASNVENQTRINANESSSSSSSSSHAAVLVSSQKNDVDRVLPLTAPTAVRVAS